MPAVSEVLRGMNGLLVKSPVSMRMAVLMVTLLMTLRIVHALSRPRDRAKASQRVGAELQA